MIPAMGDTTVRRFCRSQSVDLWLVCKGARASDIELLTRAIELILWLITGASAQVRSNGSPSYLAKTLASEAC